MNTTSSVLNDFLDFFFLVPFFICVGWFCVLLFKFGGAYNFKPHCKWIFSFSNLCVCGNQHIHVDELFFTIDRFWHSNRPIIFSKNCFAVECVCSNFFFWQIESSIENVDDFFFQIHHITKSLFVITVMNARINSILWSDFMKTHVPDVSIVIVRQQQITSENPTKRCRRTDKINFRECIASTGCLSVYMLLVTLEIWLFSFIFCTIHNWPL